MGILTGTVTEQDNLTKERRSRCPPDDATKLFTLCTQASTGITAHPVPSPSSPGLRRLGSCARGVGKWTIDLVVFTLTVTAAVSIFAPTKGPAALPIIP